jgi:hypothetical protein
VAGALVAAGLLLVASALWVVLDLDGDGLRTYAEWQHGTSSVSDDTDGDGLRDGWETDRGLDPLSTDTDGDGVDDGREIALGANPRVQDTDGDGIVDLAESLQEPGDCNQNGIHAIAEADDDSDGRPDVDEHREHRCDPDVDGDGVFDGHEGHPDCVTRVDCDGDGLDDGQEFGTTFDPLNPDTFNAGLFDSVLWAFEQAGQPPSGDDDGDGIPDTWETSAGLIDWGPFSPDASRPDMLFEFVRVQGPDSGRYAWLDLAESYGMVEAYIESDSSFEVQWVETVVVLPQEERPALIPSRYADYYKRILDAADHATNPYVTTIVMNPQHDQSQILHLGVAPIRGMLAAVDYGVHSWVEFDFDGEPIQFSPFIESVIAGDRQDVILAWGFDGGGVRANGEYFLRGDDFQVVWEPDWFASAPRLEPTAGAAVPSTYMDAGVLTTDLAQTILHELGHTLGLCHVELADCLANLTGPDQFIAETSTMFSGAEPGTLNFLGSEWDQVSTYVTCPPQEPIQKVAEDAGDDAILDSKYGYALSDLGTLGTRACGDMAPLAATFSFRDDLAVYQAPADERDPPVAKDSPVATYAYGGGSLLVGAVGGLVAGRVRWTRPRAS